MNKIIYGATLIITLIVGIGIGNYHNFSANAESGNDIIGRVSIDLSTGKIIEFQSEIAPLGILTQNAINSGYNSANIDEKYITQYEYFIWKQYGVYPPPSIAVIESLEQALLQQRVLEVQNQTEKALSKQDLQTKYQNQIDNLNTVVNNSNYIQAKTNWTNAEVIQYIKALAWHDEIQAKGQITILKILRWMLW